MSKACSSGFRFGRERWRWFGWFVVVVAASVAPCTGQDQSDRTSSKAKPKDTAPEVQSRRPAEAPGKKEEEANLKNYLLNSYKSLADQHKAQQLNEKAKELEDDKERLRRAAQAL